MPNIVSGLIDIRNIDNISPIYHDILKPGYMKDQALDIGQINIKSSNSLEPINSVLHQS